MDKVGIICSADVKLIRDPNFTAVNKVHAILLSVCMFSSNNNLQTINLAM